MCFTARAGGGGGGRDVLDENISMIEIELDGLNHFNFHYVRLVPRPL